MRAHGDDKPVRVTEYGWSSTQPGSGGGPSCERGASAGLKPSGVTAAEQATFLAQGYHCLAQEPGVEAATWFTLRDAPVSEHPLDELRHYGLLTTGGAHKPAWDVFHAIATGGDTLSGACGDFDGPAVTVVTPKVGQAYAGSLLISASARDTSAPRRITFTADGKTIQNFGDGLANDKVVSLDWQGAKQLSIGVHTITVSATDAQGNVASQDVQVRKVSASQLIAIGPAKFTLKAVKCSKAASCLLSGQLLSPSGSRAAGQGPDPVAVADQGHQEAQGRLEDACTRSPSRRASRSRCARSSALRRLARARPLPGAQAAEALVLEVDVLQREEEEIGRDLQHHAVHAAGRFRDPVGMQRVGERLQPVDQARARPAEVGGGVERDDLLGAQRAQAVAELLGLGQRTRAVVAARDADHDLGLGGRQQLPLQLLGVLAGEAEQVGRRRPCRSAAASSGRR